MPRWYMLFYTYDRDSAEEIVALLRRKGYEADYQTSAIEHSVWIRDIETVADELRSFLLDRAPELFVKVVVEEGVKIFVKDVEKFLEIVPPRNELYRKTLGLE